MRSLVLLVCLTPNFSFAQEAHEWPTQFGHSLQQDVAGSGEVFANLKLSVTEQRVLRDWLIASRSEQRVFLQMSLDTRTGQGRIIDVRIEAVSSSYPDEPFVLGKYKWDTSQATFGHYSNVNALLHKEELEGVKLNMRAIKSITHLRVVVDTKPDDRIQLNRHFVTIYNIQQYVRAD